MRLWRVVAVAEADDIRECGELRLPGPPVASLEGKLLWTEREHADRYRGLLGRARWSAGDLVVEIHLDQGDAQDPRVSVGPICDGMPTRWTPGDDLPWFNQRATLLFVDVA